MAAITVKNLSKKYAYHVKQPGMWNSVKAMFYRETLYAHAVRDISFQIDEGELVGFLGPNGAGKTTTLKMLTGIIHPTSGEADVLGFHPEERRNAFKRQFAFVSGQKNQLWWDLPAMESFILNKEIYELPDAQFKHSLSELTALLDIGGILDIQVRKLSLGQRMKCELATALLHQPRILFLDEPTIGLDVVSQHNIRGFLKKYNQEKRVTIILTSHYMEDVEALCQRVVMINQGSILYDGRLAELMERYATKKFIEVTFTQDVAPASLANYGELRDHSPARAILSVPKGEARERVTALLRDLPVDDILINEMPVDEMIRTIFTSLPAANHS